jgi:hypothetical protein
MVFATPPPLTPRERQKLYPPLPSFQKNLFYGGGAGLVGALCTFPVDTAKTRVQNEKVAPGQQRQYRSIISALLTIRRTQGVRGLYNGLQVRAGQPHALAYTHIAQFTHTHTYACMRILHTLSPPRCRVLPGLGTM